MWSAERMLLVGTGCWCASPALGIRVLREYGGELVVGDAVYAPVMLVDRETGWLAAWYRGCRSGGFEVAWG